MTQGKEAQLEETAGPRGHPYRQDGTMLPSPSPTSKRNRETSSPQTIQQLHPDLRDRLLPVPFNFMRLRRALRLLRRGLCRRQGQGIFRDHLQPRRDRPTPRTAPASPAGSNRPAAEGDDPDGQKFAWDLRAGGGLGLGGTRQPALKWRPFPGKAPAQGNPGRRQEAPDREILRPGRLLPGLKHSHLGLS